MTKIYTVNLYSNMLTEELFIIFQNLKQPSCPKPEIIKQILA